MEIPLTALLARLGAISSLISCTRSKSRSPAKSLKISGARRSSVGVSIRVCPFKRICPLPTAPHLPFGSQPCAATGFFNSPSRRLRFLCDRVERSGANCSMNRQIRVRRHTRTRHRAASIVGCRTASSNRKICKACGKLKGLWKKFDGVRGNERTTKPRSARRLGRTG